VANQFIRKLILISYIFPLSVKVNLELARLVYCQRINTDPGIAGAVARNSTLCEDMARIKYLLTDKTGTLTMNEMVFRAMVVREGRWEEAEDGGKGRG
jgi:phospholipid-translocating ATPase